VCSQSSVSMGSTEWARTGGSPLMNSTRLHWVVEASALVVGVEAAVALVAWLLESAQLPALLDST
jgi:hypothetical protein